MDCTSWPTQRKTHPQHDGLLLFLVDGVVGAVHPRVGAQVPQPHVRAPAGWGKDVMEPCYWGILTGYSVSFNKLLFLTPRS